MEIHFKIPPDQQAAFINEIKEAIKEELKVSKLVSENESSDENEYLNRQEACKFIRCSLATLFNYQKAGRLPFFKIGRKVLFKKSDLIAAMKVKPIHKQYSLPI
jgi:excisionase family DNA binding protein